jgi:acyl carrier protein
VDKTPIRSKVRTFIIDNFLLGSTDGFHFDDETQLVDSGIMDSTAAMELVAFLEATFNIAIDESEIVPENLNSVNHITDFVDQKNHDKGVI